jgi:hypothetical protein
VPCVAVPPEVNDTSSMSAHGILVALVLAGPGQAQTSEVMGSVRIPAEVERAAVRVELVLTGDGCISPADERVEARADAQGGFRFEGVGPGAVHVLARAPGWVSAPLDLGLSRAARVEGLELALEPAARVHGRLLAANGAADVGRTVSLVWRETFRVEGVTGPAGELELGGVPGGPVEVTAWPTEAEVAARAQAASAPPEAARKALLRTRRLVLVGGASQEVAFAPLSAALVRLGGRVHLQPPRGHTVFAHSALLGLDVFTRTDAHGAYELWLPGPGSYELEVVVPLGLAGISHVETLELSGAATVHDIQVPLGRLELLVQEHSGKPCPGAEIHMRVEEGGEASEAWLLARTDAEGRLELAQAPVHRLGFAATAGERTSPWTSVTVTNGRHLRVVLFVEP